MSSFDIVGCVFSLNSDNFCMQSVDLGKIVSLGANVLPGSTPFTPFDAGPHHNTK